MQFSMQELQDKTVNYSVLDVGAHQKMANIDQKVSKIHLRAASPVLPHVGQSVLNADPAEAR